MTDHTISQAKTHMLEVLQALKDQLNSLHVGRANAAMVEGIMVDYYGSTMPLKQVASIAVPEPNQITLTPWDKGALAPIEQAIRQSDLGVNPINDGKTVRIVLPPLTEERRRELSKVVGKMAEEARIALRNQRHEALDQIGAAQKDGKITEDDRDRARSELDKIIDGMNKDVDQIARAKEQEMMSL